MFENLSERLERSFKLLKGQGRITEINVAETLKEVRRALLDADVNFKIAKQFTDGIKQKAMGQQVLSAVNPSQMMIKIVHDELVELMGSDKSDISLKINPSIILIAGLQGSGKTTFSGKLASWVKTKKGKNPLLVAGDVYRPAAIEQLKVIGEQVQVPVYTEEGNMNPLVIAKNSVKEAKKNGYNVVIIDTAGRLSIDEEMMNEIASVKAAVSPHEILFVVDSMTGQDAVNTAKEFNERLDFDGVVLTKLDGDTRGGAALSIKSVVNKPVKFVSSGEKMDAIDIFYPQRMADRILGMGDIVSLVEKAQEQYDLEEARKLQKKIAKNQFDFNDFIAQIPDRGARAGEGPRGALPERGRDGRGPAQLSRIAARDRHRHHARLRSRPHDDCGGTLDHVGAEENRHPDLEAGADRSGRRGEPAPAPVAPLRLHGGPGKARQAGAPR